LVSSRDIGIFALIGIGALALFKKAGGSSIDFDSAPATPQSVLFGEALQSQFDTLGDVIDQQDTALQEAQRLLKLKFNQQQKSGSSRPTLGSSLVPTFLNSFRSTVGFQSNLIGGNRGSR